MKQLKSKQTGLHNLIKKKFFKQKNASDHNLANETHTNAYDEYVGYYYSGTRWSLGR